MNERMCLICSPYGGDDKNILLARRFMKLAAARGLAPFASHVMMHGVLDDHIEAERALGCFVGMEIMKICGVVWMCGNSQTWGMRQEEIMAKLLKIPIEFISLDELLEWEQNSL